MKATSQGLGHGHFDKMTWQLYDHGEEIVSDYGAARFLNIEAKFGGRYLPENNSWAKQTIAHNTLVVDENSHFNRSLKDASQYYPELNYFHAGNNISITSATINTAYPDADMTRTLATLIIPNTSKRLIVDLFSVSSKKEHQFDLPLHYQGQLINTNFSRSMNTTQLRVLGKKNGYEHLWLKGESSPTGEFNQITWLNKNGRFYTHSSINTKDQQILFVELGANDPNSNLRRENAFITRIKNSKRHTFVSIIEPHGEYNPSEEYTLDAVSKVSGIGYSENENTQILEINYQDKQYLLLINLMKNINEPRDITYTNREYQLTGRARLVEITH